MTAIKANSLDMGSKGVSGEISADGLSLTIHVDLSGNFGASSTGKTVTVAHGQVKLQNGIRVGVNAYTK
jgi:hypothetical protein